MLANTDCLERRRSLIIMRREINIYHRLQNRLISGHSHVLVNTNCLERRSPVSLLATGRSLLPECNYVHVIFCCCWALHSESRLFFLSWIGLRARQFACLWALWRIYLPWYDQLLRFDAAEGHLRHNFLPFFFFFSLSFFFHFSFRLVLLFIGFILFCSLSCLWSL